ncbi:hypothetical protein O9929_06495 [Vibrio lentus]|nr:hypothetical protein [Vibrio lentus]
MVSVCLIKRWPQSRLKSVLGVVRQVFEGSPNASDNVYKFGFTSRRLVSAEVRLARPSESNDDVG